MISIQVGLFIVRGLVVECAIFGTRDAGIGADESIQEPRCLVPRSPGHEALSFLSVRNSDVAKESLLDFTHIVPIYLQ